MGIARSIGKALGGFIFTTSLAFAILMLTAVEFTEYESLKPIFVGAMEKQMDEAKAEEISRIHDELVKACAGKQSIEVPFGGEGEEGSGGEIVKIDCSELTASKAEDFGKITATALFDKIYYKQYDCKFIDCLQAGHVAAIMSAEAHNFFRDMQSALWIGIAIGAVMLLISIETWQGRLKGFGIPLIFTGLPFIILNLAGGLIVQKLPMQAMPEISPAINQILSSISNRYFMVFIGGIVLTACGYALAYYQKRKQKKRQKKKKRK